MNTDQKDGSTQRMKEESSTWIDFLCRFRGEPDSVLGLTLVSTDLMPFMRVRLSVKDAADEADIY